VRRAVIVVSFVLGIAGDASALDLCVSHEGTCPNQRPTIEAAVTEAAATPGADTIFIDEGHYTDDNPVVPADADGPIALNGLRAGGADASIIQWTPGEPTPRLSRAGSSVTKIRFEPPPGDTGLILEGDVVAHGMGVAGGETGVVMSGGARLLESNVTSDALAVEVDDAMVADASLAACAAVRAVGGASEIVRTIAVGATGYATTDGAQLDVDSSLAQLEPATGCPTGPGLIADGGGDITARHVTVVGDGSAGSRGIVVRRTTAGHSTVAAHSTLLHDVALAVEHALTAGTATTSLDASMFEASAVSGTAVAGSGNVPAAEPRFAPAPGFRPRHDSPLIDAGLDALDPAWSPEDASGGVRVVGRRDIGAWEYQRVRPLVQATGPAVVRVGEPAAFRAFGSDEDAGDPLALRWSFGASGESATHVFTQPGPATVSVAASDPSGLTATAAVGVLVTPAPSGTAPPPAETPRAAPPPARVARLRFGALRSVLRVDARRRAGVPVSCDSACSGAVAVETLPRRRGRAAAVAGRTRFRLPRGGSRLLRVRVTRVLARRARSRRGVRVRVVLRPDGGAAIRRTVTLRAARR
jgi:PKD domain